MTMAMSTKVPSRLCPMPESPLGATSFCPDRLVTRGEMAAFWVRGLDLTANGGTDFTDDNQSIFEADIERLATAGITKGCNPPANTNFCPNQTVTRAEMAAFLVRALGLTAPTRPSTSQTTTDPSSKTTLKYWPQQESPRAAIPQPTPNSAQTTG